MARPLLVRVFVDDLPLKVLSMLLAVTLFVLVRNDKDASSGATVKVIYAVPDDKVLVSDPVTEVKVNVRGPWTKLSHLDRALAPIHVDLTRLVQKAGGADVHIDEDAIKVPPGVRVTSVVPSDVRIEVQPRVERQVPVQPILEGQPADGYRVAKLSARPERVRVDGAKAAVESIERAPTRPLRINNATGPKQGEVALEPPPAHTRFVDVTTVTVVADVQPAIIEKIFAALPIKVLGLSRMEASVEPATASLTLRGPSPLVGQITGATVSVRVDAALADTRPPQKYARQLTVSGLPPGVAAEVQPDTIVLTTRRKRE